LILWKFAVGSSVYGFAAGRGSDELLHKHGCDFGGGGPGPVVGIESLEAEVADLDGLGELGGVWGDLVGKLASARKSLGAGGGEGAFRIALRDGDGADRDGDAPGVGILAGGEGTDREAQVART
jgi:hypothetical protein